MNNTVPVIDKAVTGNISSDKPLRDCVADSVRAYFGALNGQQVGNLYNMVLSEVEEPLLQAVLSYTNGNQSKASEVLGINRGTLRKKLKLYGLHQ
ncbi:DNA-binding transcriptional regulator Fis [Beggiatoa alba]|nr:DNA-binding transcriptional regulator Fis [Beggiatoa alba]